MNFWQVSMVHIGNCFELTELLDNMQ